jgi:hypothetical protein
MGSTVHGESRPWAGKLETKPQHGFSVTAVEHRPIVTHGRLRHDIQQDVNQTDSWEEVKLVLVKGLPGLQLLILMGMMGSP